MSIQCNRVVSCGEDDVGGSDAQLLIKFVENALIQAVLGTEDNNGERAPQSEHSDGITTRLLGAGTESRLVQVFWTRRYARVDATALTRVYKRPGTKSPRSSGPSGSKSRIPGLREMRTMTRPLPCAKKMTPTAQRELRALRQLGQ